MVHYISLVRLPSPSETAELLTLHVFWLHGLPTDTVSDSSLQFTSQVWQAFCKAFGTTSSLRSGYHPQSNGQTELTRAPFAAQQPVIPLSGPHFSLGSNMHTIHCPAKPQGFLIISLWPTKQSFPTCSPHVSCLAAQACVLQFGFLCLAFCFAFCCACRGALTGWAEFSHHWSYWHTHTPAAGLKLEPVKPCSPCYFEAY